MNLIWLLLRASWLNVAVAVLTGLISGGCSARLIALINSAVSGATDNILWYFVGLGLIIFFTTIISQFFLIELAQSAVYSLRLRLSGAILSSPLRHLEELGANRLMATLTEDVQTLSGAVFIMPTIFIEISIILGCLVYLSWLSAVVFIVTIVFLVLAIASIQFLLNKARHSLSLAREEEDRLFKHFRTITDGIKELKLHSQRRQQFLSEELQVSAAASRQHNITALRTFAIGDGWGQMLFFTIVCFLLLGLPRLVPVTPAVLSAYILTIAYLLTPLRNIILRLPQFFKASVSLQKIEKMRLTLASQTEETTFSSSSPIPSSVNSTVLELNDVTHTYRGEHEESSFILGALNLTFHPGELVFIVGGNGSGKSTLAKLITGLYIPEAGEIRLDGKLITDANRDWYRQHFSVIFSDFYLFERLLGIDNSNLDIQAQNYLQQLHLERKVKVENGILSTTALSQGQRKRLALLTAYLENRPIYLFDEWASDQDPFFRDIFYKQILVTLKQQGKIVLVISHDDRYFHLADRVIKLDYGKVEYDRQN